MDARILFVINRPAIGGAQLHTLELAKALAGEGADCSLYAVQPEADSALAQFVPVARHQEKRRGVLGLSRYAAEYRPDVIVVAQTAVLFRIAVSKFFARVTAPAVVIVHGWPRSGLPRAGSIERWIRVRLINRARLIVFLSEGQKRAWQAVGMRSGHCVVIPNGVDVDKFSPDRADAYRNEARRSFGFLPADIVVGTAARLHPVKRIDLLVLAISELRKRGVAAKGLIVGDGPLRGDLLDLVAKLQLQESVVFAGARADVDHTIAAMDIGVLPSSSEVMPLFALECMAMGRPVVLTDAGGTADIVGDGSGGRLFHSGDAGALAAEIIAYLDGKVRGQAGAEARRKVVRNFSRQRMFESYISVLQPLAAASRLESHRNGADAEKSTGKLALIH